MAGAPPGGSGRRSRAGLWVLAIFFTAGILIVAAVGYRTYSSVQSFLHGSTTCLPSEFPKYPGAAYADQELTLNGPYPGSGCHVVLESNDDVVTVTAFYMSKLSSGSWRVTPTIDQGDKVDFQPAGGAPPFGTVQVAPNNTHTEITIDLYASTCLPPDFPMYPRAMFGGQSATAETRNACHIVFVSNDRVAAVTAFYKAELNMGNWHIDSTSGGRIDFRFIVGKRTTFSGTVVVATRGDHTMITIDAYS